MSMHLRNSRDMMDPQEEEGWWNSKTGLEQKLIILSSLLFVLSFCLVISVIVINNRKTGSGGKVTEGPDLTTTLEPITETTLNGTNPTEEDVTTVEPPTTENSTTTEEGTKSTPSITSENATDSETTTLETEAGNITTVTNSSDTENEATILPEKQELERSVGENLSPQENPTGRKLLSRFNWQKIIDAEEEKDDTDLSILYFKRNSLLNRMPLSNIPGRS